MTNKVGVGTSSGGFETSGLSGIVETDEPSLIDHLTNVSVDGSQAESRNIEATG